MVVIILLTKKRTKTTNNKTVRRRIFSFAKKTLINGQIDNLQITKNKHVIHYMMEYENKKEQKEKPLNDVIL